MEDVAGLLLVVLNLPLVGLWVRLLTVPYHYLYPCIIVICCIGVYSVSNNPVDVFGMAAFGTIGYALLKLDCEPAPLLLGFVLGPMLEEHLRRSLLLSHGDASIFVVRPISGLLLAVGVLAILSVLVPKIRHQRDEAFRE